MREKLYWYEARLAHEGDVSKYTRPVVDGDSVYLWLDMGLHTWNMQLCRLAGIDAPERGDMDGYDEATTALEDSLTGADEVIVSSDELGKYGRPIVTIFRRVGDEWRNVNDWLVEEGYAEREDY